MPERLELSATPEALRQVKQWLQELKGRYALPDIIVGELNVILEELVMNIIKHAKPTPPSLGPIPVRIEADLSDRRVMVRVMDESLPFDPLSRPKPNLSLDLNDRPIGGLGIHLVRELSDRFQYSYEQGWNVSLIEKTMHQENRE